MGWNELLQKTSYWLGLRAARTSGAIAPAVAMPTRVDWRKVAAWKHDNFNVSSIHPLSGGKILVGCYDNKSRKESRLHVVEADGSVNEIYKGGEETIGQGWFGGGQWWLPVECGAQQLITVPQDGSSASRHVSQNGKYSARVTDGHVGVGNQVFAITDTSKPVASMPKLAGILSGLVRLGDEWIASDDERGIQSSEGWFIEALCPDLAIVGGRVLAFLRSGEVRLIEDGKLSTPLGNTTRKCRRVWVNGSLAWWSTAPSDGDGHHQVWVTNGESMLRVGQFNGLAESTTAGALGSLFGSAVCVDSDNAVWLAAANETKDGWVLYRGTPTYPVSEPEPAPEPSVEEQIEQQVEEETVE